jgi:hypothetical protein
MHKENDHATPLLTSTFPYFFQSFSHPAMWWVSFLHHLLGVAKDGMWWGSVWAVRLLAPKLPAEKSSSRHPIPTIYQTDLWRPKNDLLCRHSRTAIEHPEPCQTQQRRSGGDPKSKLLNRKRRRSISSSRSNLESPQPSPSQKFTGQRSTRPS